MLAPRRHCLKARSLSSKELLAAAPHSILRMLFTLTLLIILCVHRAVTVIVDVFETKSTRRCTWTVMYEFVSIENPPVKREVAKWVRRRTKDWDLIAEQECICRIRKFRKSGTRDEDWIWAFSGDLELADKEWSRDSNTAHSELVISFEGWKVSRTNVCLRTGILSPLRQYASKTKLVWRADDLNSNRNSIWKMRTTIERRKPKNSGGVFRAESYKNVRRNANTSSIWCVQNFGVALNTMKSSHGDPVLSNKGDIYWLVAKYCRIKSSNRKNLDLNGSGKSPVYFEISKIVLRVIPE